MTRIGGQGEFARALRLREGRCPVHGCDMPQCGLAEEYEGLKESDGWAVVGCPRRDCDVLAQESEPWGPAKLAPWVRLEAE